MASIYKRGDQWWIKYYQRGRPVRRSLKTTQKRVAQREQQVIEAELLNGHRHVLEERDISVPEFKRAWLPWAERNLTRKTRESMLQRFESFVETARPHYLGDVSLRDVRAFKSHLQNTRRSNTTVNNYLRDLSSIYKHASVELGVYTGPNPFKQVRRLPVEWNPIPFLNSEQIEKLLEAAASYDENRGSDKSHVYWFFLLPLYAGLRKREIGFVSWDWFDWNERTLIVPNTLTFRSKARKYRKVPLHSKIIEAMMSHTSEKGYVFAPHRTDPPKGHYRYFPSKAFGQVLTAASLERIRMHGNEYFVTPQVLRYSFGSRLIQEGENIKKVSMWLGHSSVLVTERHYIGLLGYDEGIERI